MKIELKSIDYSEGLSESACAFTAKLYVDGRYVADARNRGKDTVCFIDRRAGVDSDVLEQAEIHCRKLKGASTVLAPDEQGAFFI